MERFPKILYWKWDAGIFDKLDYGLKDCMARFDFDLLYVSFHHLPLEFADPALLRLIRKTVGILAADGRKLLLDIDARNELAAFKRAYPQPENEGCVTRFWERTLDSRGECRFTVPNPAAGRTGRAGKPRGPVGLAGAWTLVKTAGGTEYAPGSLEALGPETVEIIDLGAESRFEIHTHPSEAGKTLVLAAIFPHGIPDIFSEHLEAFYSTMFDAVADIPLGGAAVDEWGYDLALACDDGLFYVDAFPYSAGLCARYTRETGRTLDADLIHFAYSEEGRRGESLGVVNDYLALIRRRMRENNRWFYDETKRRLGECAFVGVHPTFWGDPSDFSVDALHNGISWWETPRDFAQTDEFVIMPIRTALAHKWGGSVFYNMWYSGNTQQLDTYWQETWRNARFGGRTHYLGYECPNEPGVYRLKHPGGLEGVDAMERRITEIDLLERSQPDCRALIVFGLEGACNWRLRDCGAKVVRGAGPLTEVLRYAAGVFEAVLCDLVPSTELISGVVIEGAAVRYGTQTYDAMVYLCTECMDRAVLAALKDFAAAGGKLALSGGCRYYSDGAEMDKAFEELKAMAAVYFPEAPSVLETVTALEAFGVPRNRWHNGCVYQDGSLLFTADALRPTGNWLEVDCEYKGRHIRHVGEDFFYVPPFGL
ncbi:MAG: hypothetical protein LBS62_01005 [Clostridiales bacterium]|jgi:hypothetical protein|nr:hypothetical protein [Clostridiales bacterium]